MFLIFFVLLSCEDSLQGHTGEQQVVPYLKAAKAQGRGRSDGYTSENGTWLRDGALPFPVVTLSRVGPSKLVEIL